MSQNSQILEYLKRGRSLTPLVALDRFGIFRLAARIAELKANGHPIRTHMVHVGKTKKVASYSL